MLLLLFFRLLLLLTEQLLMFDFNLRELKVAKSDLSRCFCVANRHRAPLKIFAPESKLFSFFLIDGRLEIILDVF